MSIVDAENKLKAHLPQYNEVHKFLSIASCILVNGELESVCSVLPSTALGYDLEVMGTNSAG